MIQGISGVVLAGGSSRRFGGITKANISIGGRTVISRITDVLEGIFSKLILVTNTPEEFAGSAKYIITKDEFTGVGPLGGIHAAMKLSGAGAVFVFAGDMPFIGKNIILRQIGHYQNHKDCQLIVARKGEFIEPLHAIYSTSLLPSIENYLSSARNHAVYEFIGMHKPEYFDLEDTEEARNEFININSPADIPAAERILKSQRKESE